jgi:hypothetical protein
MSRPDPRQQGAALPASFARAIDLSALKKRASTPPTVHATSSKTKVSGLL